MRVREIVGDMQSAEIQQMRRSFNSLLRMLETAEASLTAGADAEDVLNAWADAIRTGQDDNPASIANVVSTDNEMLGIRITPTPLRKAQAKARVVEDDGTDA